VSLASKELTDRGNRKICGDLLSYRYAFKRWAVRSCLMCFKCDGPLIKGSRDSVTAVNYFAALPSEALAQAGLNFWFVLFQDKMNRKTI